MKFLVKKVKLIIGQFTVSHKLILWALFNNTHTIEYCYRVSYIDKLRTYMINNKYLLNKLPIVANHWKCNDLAWKCCENKAQIDKASFRAVISAFWAILSGKQDSNQVWLFTFWEKDRQFIAKLDSFELFLL